MSFDKGFSSAANKELLESKIPTVILPKKRKLSQKKEYAQQHTKNWKHLRHPNSAVESNINSLEHHGLDHCPDRGLSHYKSYAGLGILSYNLDKMGKVLQKKEKQELKRKKSRRKGVA